MMAGNLTDADHKKFMQDAIDLSAHGALVEKAGGCFGAIIVDVNTKEVVATGYNQVVGKHDPTWHGEVHCIREACSKLKTFHLPNCVIYTSAQPCPMCMAACMWANLQKVYYAATYEDVAKYGGFTDSNYLAELAKPEAERIVPSIGPFMREEAVEVWKKYEAMPDKQHY